MFKGNKYISKVVLAPEQNAIKYKVVEVRLHAFLTSILDGVK
jgi:hypothetical protein